MKGSTRTLAFTTVLVHLIALVFNNGESNEPNTTHQFQDTIYLTDATDFLGVHVSLLLQSEAVDFVATKIKLKRMGTMYSLRQALLSERAVAVSDFDCAAGPPDGALLFILTPASLPCFRQLLNSPWAGPTHVVYGHPRHTLHFQGVPNLRTLYLPLLYGPWCNLDNPALQKLQNSGLSWRHERAIFVMDAAAEVLQFLKDPTSREVEGVPIFDSHFTHLGPKREMMSRPTFPGAGLPAVKEWWAHFVQEPARRKGGSADAPALTGPPAAKPEELHLVGRKQAAEFQGKRNVLMTCYITEKQDPQRKGKEQFVEKDHSMYMVRFYNTLRYLDLEHTDVVIFNDGLSDKFKDDYPVIKFEDFEWDDYAREHFLSVNDQRYLLYLRFLERRAGAYDFALVTDLHDVSFGGDPFAYMRASAEFYLFSGSEAKKAEWSGWVQQRLRTCYKDQGKKLNRFWDRPEVQFLNAGVFGGMVNRVITALEMIKQEFESLPITKVENCNYGVYNYVLFTISHQDGDNRKIKVGSPWHSPFKEKSSIKDHEFYIYHK